MCLANQKFKNLHVYLIIHNIDGMAFRTPKAQTVLSILATIPQIHIVASIDHINAPLRKLTTQQCINEQHKCNWQKYVYLNWVALENEQCGISRWAAISIGCGTKLQRWNTTPQKRNSKLLLLWILRKVCSFFVCSKSAPLISWLWRRRDTNEENWIHPDDVFFRIYSFTRCIGRVAECGEKQAGDIQDSGRVSTQEWNW